jgi:ribose 5-phosphate isomerase
MILTSTSSRDNNYNNNNDMQRRSSMQDGETNNNNLLLDVAFSSLNDVDKYETVLAGLCAKIIDTGTESYSKSSISDIIQLVQEMNVRGVSAGPRGIISLIDVS